MVLLLSTILYSTPIAKLAKISESGAQQHIIYGLSIGMESVVLPMFFLAGSVVCAFTYGGGVFGVSLAAVAMLATVGITMTVDAYGPIADNGRHCGNGGIRKKCAHYSDRLDSLGNTTAAIGKGFAYWFCSTCGIECLCGIQSEAGLDVLDLLNPLVLAGIFIGAAMPFWISALTMRSVGNAALKMVVEVRRQFKKSLALWKVPHSQITNVALQLVLKHH